MEVFAAALQVAGLIETPSTVTFEAIRKNFYLNGLSPDHDWLSHAPPADWVDKAEESSKRPPSPTQLEAGARPKKNRHESLI